MKTKLIYEFREKILQNLEQVIIGKTKTLNLVIMGLICHGHLLIEDVPGLGKTMIAKSLAISLGCDFKRMQFTPDLLPSDVTGVSIFNQATKKFEFQPGPIIAEIVLADEINRATPKTQSALLEAMEERQVTVDGITHPLPPTFMVIGTQNPIEYEGTFPLPEAQLDRFLMKIKIGYPSESTEMQILDAQQFQHPIQKIKSVTTRSELKKVQDEVKHVFVSNAIKNYLIKIVRSTRENDDIYLGASPRGSLALYKVGQAYAAFQGREYVTPDDIKEIVEPVLAHRIVVQPAARIKNLTASQILNEIIDSVPISVER